MTFEGKVAIVTGAGTGLGAAVARRLAAQGAKVIVNYSRSRNEAQGVADEIVAAGGEAVAFQGNVDQDEDCRRLVAETVDRWGRVDILVNNAARTKLVAHDDLDGLSAEDFLAIYRTNVVGAYQMVRACRPLMKAQGFGAVVNVSSIGGLLGVGSCMAYSASKGALNTMTMAMARSLGPEIRVNAVCPGFIASRWFSDPFGQEGLQQMIEAQQCLTPLARAGTPEDIAKAVVFLAGEGAEHITGVTLISDAGLHLSTGATTPRKEEMTSGR
ncbi:SDR family NAD(P)-dependent oxidoreductase [Sphingobium indicum]|uniref:SDR family NAD(P)-dependent oxidoreductase n=1 Tax=Sphingobium indicum TaxID=332055 RepID=UPI0035E49F16